MSAIAGRSDAPIVIAVAGPVGGGKSTLVRGLAARLVDAAVIHFDDYEQVTAQPIETIRQWLKDGADLDEIVIPGLPEDLDALKQGRTITASPACAAITPRKFILFETQFGRQHAATGKHIDFLIWIDTPLDLALARKLRQFAADTPPCDAGQARDFVAWMQAYLDNYLGVVGELLRIQRDTVGARADLRVDGKTAADALAQQVAREILQRYP